MIAIGCLTATQCRGEWPVAGYVIAIIAGAAAHVGEATVNGAEICIAVSVMLLGALLFRKEPLRLDLEMPKPQSAATATIKANRMVMPARTRMISMGMIMVRRRWKI